MAGTFGDHPLLTYVTFVLPIVLLTIALVVQASVFLIILIVAWLGVSFVVLFLPIETDDGSSG
jgi:F0F1-type ATP synthase assembly protein I